MTRKEQQAPKKEEEKRTPVLWEYCWIGMIYADWIQVSKVMNVQHK